MRVEPYEGDKLARIEADVAQILARYPDPRSGLLPMLHLVQSVDGYVTAEGITFCARTLGLSTAEVSGVATFYTQYKRRPTGDYLVGVCTNTLCAIMGGDVIFDELSAHLGIGNDETTEDGTVGLERLECNAACDHAPVMMVNWEFFDQQTPESAVDVVDRLRAGEPVAPTRGADRVVTFAEASRVLAGFADGRADEGVGASETTLVGLRLAKDQGWTAPEPGAVPAETEEPATAEELKPVAPVPGGPGSSAEVPAQGDSVEPTDEATRAPAHDTREGDPTGEEA